MRVLSSGLFIVVLALCLTLSTSMVSNAQDAVTLTATDNPGTTSFNTNLHWSDGLAPHSGTNYLVNSGRVLRTPENVANYIFLGDSLTLNNGNINLKGNGQITIADLRLFGCRIATGQSGIVTIYGTNTINGTTDAPSRYSGSQSRTTSIYGVLQGTGELQVDRTEGESTGDFNCCLYADNSAFSGGMTVKGTGIKLGIAFTNSLGGELSGFRADALRLKDSGTVYSLNAGALASPTRGITVDNGGIIEALFADMTNEMQITGTGNLYVKGGSHITTLNSVMTLAGDVVVDGGNLLIGNAFSLTPTNRIVLVNSGVLQGTTPVVNDLSVEGGKINAGTVGGVDTLTVSNVYFAAGAFEFDFAPGVTSDFLRITGSLTRAPGVPFSIIVTQPVTNETGRFALLTAANLGDYTTNDFTLARSYYNLPEGHLELADDGDGLALFFVQARPVVELTAGGSDQGDSFTNGSRWSDGQVPNDSNDYIVALSRRLRTDDGSTAAQTRTRTFGGHSLTLADGADMRCKGQRAVVSDLRLYNKRITQGMPPNTQYLGGNITVLGNFEIQNDGSLSRVLIIDSQISGTNTIRFKISDENPTFTVNGKFALTAANTNFTGAIQVMGTNLTYLTISDERNLGGTPPAFRADQLLLDTTGVLQVATSVTLEDPNRGIKLTGWGGVLDVAATGATLSVACPISGTTLYKRGTGILALSGANTYNAGTVVEAGTLEVASESALGSGPATFATGTSLRVPRDATALPHGVRLGGATPLTVDAPLPVVPLFGSGTLPKAFDLPVFLLTGATTFDTALLSLRDTPVGYDVTVETRSVDDGGTPRTQVYLRYRWVGTLIMVL